LPLALNHGELSRGRVLVTVRRILDKRESATYLSLRGGQRDLDVPPAVVIADPKPFETRIVRKRGDVEGRIAKATAVPGRVWSARSSWTEKDYGPIRTG
jgi:hypothetical protein